jgi:hypothetical protein
MEENLYMDSVEVYMGSTRKCPDFIVFSGSKEQRYGLITEIVNHTTHEV